jgi:hypothetical protein
MEDSYDVLIIGAGTQRPILNPGQMLSLTGPSGLCAAKTWVESEQNVKIGLVDSVSHLS